MPDPLLILVCNDDGIEARGIKALAAAVEPLGEVWTVAPATEQSASSHSLTLTKPLRIKKHGERSFSVDGTPTDTIILAVGKVLPRKPDIVVSGINHGWNMGEDIIYSGTVAAAMEGTILGVPSVAFSLAAYTGEMQFNTAAAAARAVVKQVIDAGIPTDTLLNVNIPNLPEPELKGIRCTKQGQRRFGDVAVEKEDPRGRPYYWIAGGIDHIVEEEGNDFVTVRDGYVSVTPIHLDMTNYEAMKSVGGWDFDSMRAGMSPLPESE